MDRKFNVELASICDVKAAVVADYLKEADFVTDIDKDVKFIEDRVWVRCPRRKMVNAIGCMSEDAIANATWRLLCAGIISMAQLGNNRFDNAYWYSFTEHGLRILSDPKYARAVDKYKWSAVNEFAS